MLNERTYGQGNALLQVSDVEPNIEADVAPLYNVNDYLNSRQASDEQKPRAGVGAAWGYDYNRSCYVYCMVEAGWPDYNCFVIVNENHIVPPQHKIGFKHTESINGNFRLTFIIDVYVNEDGKYSYSYNSEEVFISTHSGTRQDLWTAWQTRIDRLKSKATLTSGLKVQVSNEHKDRSGANNNSESGA